MAGVGATLRGPWEWPERHARFSLPEAFFEGIRSPPDRKDV
jgi:hypothetical protein